MNNPGGGRSYEEYRNIIQQQQEQRQQEQEQLQTRMTREQVDECLEMRRLRAESKTYLKWGFINIIIMAIFYYDLRQYTFPYNYSYWYQIEYSAAEFISLSAIHCFAKYCWGFIFYSSPRGLTDEQRVLLDEPEDNSYLHILAKFKPPPVREDSNLIDRGHIIDWHSSREKVDWDTNEPYRWCRQNQFSNQPYKSISGGSYHNPAYVSNLTEESHYSPFYASSNEILTDVSQLPALLRRADRARETQYGDQEDTTYMPKMNLTNSFWSSNKPRSRYQLAPMPEEAPEEQGVVQFRDSNSELIKRIPLEKMSQYFINLKNWIATTILHRLVKEIERIDEMLEAKNLSDWKIGCVGLESLRKMSENQQFVQSCAPTLPQLLPFLDTFANQVYLVRRIKQLALGPYLSEYRCNPDQDYVPTDAAIIFHLLSVYFDSQLYSLPLVGGRSFYSRYVLTRQDISSTQDIINAVNNKAQCAILISNTPLKPMFNFVCHQELHSCAYDRNNLFYVIIHFLIYMREYQDAMLEGVNLGSGGINIMCVIED